jgi:hypothetical protein
VKKGKIFNYFILKKERNLKLYINSTANDEDSASSARGFHSLSQRVSSDSVD